MDAVAGLFGDEEQRRAERVRALERQRMLLAGLRDDVEVAEGRLLAGSVASWRSESARRYLEQRDQLCGEVRQVVWALEEALRGVRSALAALAEDG